MAQLRLVMAELMDVIVRVLLRTARVPSATQEKG